MKTFQSEHGSITIASHGATWVSWKIPTPAGLRELLIPPEDERNNPDYRGSFVGPFAGRIGSESGIILHGGEDGYSKLEWDLEVTSSGIKATHDNMVLHYELIDHGVTLHIMIRPTSPEKLNVTTHPYFRLSESVDDVWLQIPASSIVKTKDQLGIGFMPVPEELNFRGGKLIGDRQIDHCYLSQGLTLCSKELCLTLEATTPSVVVYTYDYPASGEKRQGLAIEPQYPINGQTYTDQFLVYDYYQPYEERMTWRWSLNHGNHQTDR